MNTDTIYNRLHEHFAVAQAASWGRIAARVRLIIGHALAKRPDLMEEDPFADFLFEGALPAEFMPAPKPGGTVRPAYVETDEARSRHQRQQKFERELRSLKSEYNERPQWLTLDGKRKFRIIRIGYSGSGHMRHEIEHLSETPMGLGPIHVQVHPKYKDQDGWLSDFATMLIADDGTFTIYAGNSGINTSTRVLSQGTQYTLTTSPEEEPKKQTVADIQSAMIGRVHQLLPKMILLDGKGQTRWKKLPETKITGSKESGYTLSVGRNNVTRKTLDALQAWVDEVEQKTRHLPDPQQPFFLAQGAWADGKRDDFIRFCKEYETGPLIFEDDLKALASMKKKLKIKE